MKICIAVPSRGRARIMWKGRDISLPERLCRTAFDTAKDPDNVIIKYYINDDDDSLEQYNIEFEPLLKKYEGNLIVETGPDQSTVQSWNKICASVDADLSMISGDEIQFKTQGWDEKMRETRRGHEHGVYAMNFWFDKLKYSEDFRYSGHQPVVTREWYKALGWHYPPYFWHWYVDTYTMKLAIDSGTLEYRDDIDILEKKIMDETAMRTRTNKIKERDKWLYEILVNTTMHDDIAKLKRAINGNG